MPMYKFTFQPTTSGPSGRDDGPLQVLATGTLEECQQAWESTVTGFYRDYTKCPSIGLLAQKGHVFGFHQGGKGSYSICLAPELTVNPTYEVRPASDPLDWTPAGGTLEEAEALMRNMGEGPGRLLVLRNNFNGSRTMYQANSLGYLDCLGAYESFYGV